MSTQFSEGTKKEITELFEKTVVNKTYLYREANNALEMMLHLCDFVYVADGGSVVHSQRMCRNAYNTMVPVKVAVKFGYTKPCKACGMGTYVERLLSEII